MKMKVSEIVSEKMEFDSKQFYVRVSATLFPREAKVPREAELDIKPFPIEVNRYNEIAEDGIKFDQLMKTIILG